MLSRKEQDEISVDLQEIWEFFMDHFENRIFIDDQVVCDMALAAQAVVRPILVQSFERNK